MTDKNQHLVSVRNHISPLVRTRKGAIGTVLIVLAFFVLFGPRIEADHILITAMILGAGFIAFGLGWSGVSQAIMGWSKQYDFDFEINEVRQTSASILGRSKPYKVPFIRINDIQVAVGPEKGVGGLANEAMVELFDLDGQAFVRAGMFDSKEDADALAVRLKDAVAMARKQVNLE